MGICSQTTVFYEPWNFSTPFLKIHLYFGVNHCGNEAHNLIIICVKKYFLLFTMNLLPDNFIQCSVAFVCSFRTVSVRGARSPLTPEQVQCWQIKSLHFSCHWVERSVQGCKAIFSPWSLCWNLQIRIVIPFLVMQHGHLCTKNCPEPMNSFQESSWKAVCWKLTPCTIDWNWNLTDSLVKNSPS